MTVRAGLLVQQNEFEYKRSSNFRKKNEVNIPSAELPSKFLGTYDQLA